MEIMKNFLNLEKKKIFKLPCRCSDLVANHWTQEKVAAHVKMKSPIFYPLWAATVGRAINEQEVHGLHTEPPPRGVCLELTQI